MEAYLDNSATTKPCDAAIDAMVKAMQSGYHNPSALYRPAMEAERMLIRARQAIAEKVQAGEKGVIFTSGGTEANNLAIVGYMQSYKKGGTILMSKAEHPSVKNACLAMATLHAFTVKEIPLDARGSIDLDALEGLMNESVRLICVMQVCNETGVIMPIEKITQLRDRLAPEAAIHVDGVQGFLRVPINMSQLDIQSYAISAHKIHGPKGVGALVVRHDHRITPILYGGGQQNNLRSGTENTAAIEGMRAAIEAYPHPAYSCTHMYTLKNKLVEQLRQEIPDLRIIGAQPDEEDAAAHILTISLAPVRAETMVHALEQDGVYIGTGSACSSKKGKTSPVLAAMGISPQVAETTVRISFSPHDSHVDVTYAAEKIIERYRQLSRFKRR